VGYKKKDYKRGELVKRKYYGNINKYSTPEERMAECLKIKDLIIENKPLPNLKGARKIVGQKVEKSFASPVTLMFSALDEKKNTIKPDTFLHYQSKINTFSSWLADNEMSAVTIGNFDIDIAKLFLAHLKDCGLANNTINNYKTIFGDLFDRIISLLKKEIKIGNPWKEIDGLAKSTHPYRIYNAKTEKFIAEKLPDYNRQLWLFVLMTYFGFIRGTENKAIKIDDIDFDNRKIIVHSANAKNKKERMVAIPPPLYDEFIHQQIDKYPPDYYLFSYNGIPGEKLPGKNYFRNKWNAFRKAYNIDVSYKLYAWKHTGMIKATFNLFTMF
jgi:integrase